MTKDEIANWIAGFDQRLKRLEDAFNSGGVEILRTYFDRDLKPQLDALKKELKQIKDQLP
ncbi:MAG: hypothetical protein ABSD29_13455 [Verrucomicrobiota bacterium]|jgi:hypothetical protein